MIGIWFAGLVTEKGLFRRNLYSLHEVPRTFMAADEIRARETSSKGSLVHAYEKGVYSIHYERHM
jgi:hypothetical protein